MPYWEKLSRHSKEELCRMVMIADTLIESSRERKQHRNLKNPSLRWLSRICPVHLRTTSKEPSNVLTWKYEYFNDPKALLRTFLSSQGCTDELCKDVQMLYLPQLICSHAVHLQGRCILNDLLSMWTRFCWWNQCKEHYRSAENPTAPSYKNMTFSRHYMKFINEPK